MPLRSAADYMDHFVALVLGHIDREYPNKLDHVMNDGAEVRSPRDLHPIFFGSFDWHSSVHGHWLLVRALKDFPALGQRDEVIRLLDGRLTEGNVATEVEYLKKPRRETFERTYGWAWFLKLAAEVREGTKKSSRRGAESAEKKNAEKKNAEKTGADHGQGETDIPFDRWDRILAPLASAFVDRYLKWLPKATYPVRVGTHQNTAFGLALAVDWAAAAGLADLQAAVAAKARDWYLKDENYPAWEPDGIDFLSPGLMEAECMRRVLPAGEFVPWFDRFFPRLAKGEKEPATLFQPAFVSDRTDGHITHLDGLNLSRAWCWRRIAGALPDGDPRRPLLEDAYKTHLDAALPHVTGDYMGEHWLATFALLAMTE